MPVGIWNVPMKLLISDTNILIDMEAGNLVEVMFRLPEIFAVPNILGRTGLCPDERGGTPLAVAGSGCTNQKI